MPKIIIIALLTIVSTFSPSFATEETITLTTYYPSPYGSYNSLQAKRIGVGDNNNDGTFDSNDIPTTDGDVWIKGRLGIGTTTSSQALSVKGDADVNGKIFFTRDSGWYGSWTGVADEHGERWMHFGGEQDSEYTASPGDGTRKSLYAADKHWFWGRIGVGTNDPQASLDIADTGLLKLGKNNVDRTDAPEGTIYYNTNSDTIRYYTEPGGWKSMGGSLITAVTLTKSNLSYINDNELPLFSDGTRATWTQVIAILPSPHRTFIRSNGDSHPKSTLFCYIRVTGGRRQVIVGTSAGNYTYDTFPEQYGVANVLIIAIRS